MQIDFLGKELHLGRSGKHFSSKYWPTPIKEEDIKQSRTEFILLQLFCHAFVRVDHLLPCQCVPVCAYSCLIHFKQPLLVCRTLLSFSPWFNGPIWLVSLLGLIPASGSPSPDILTSYLQAPAILNLTPWVCLETNCRLLLQLRWADTCCGGLPRKWCCECPDEERVHECFIWKCLQASSSAMWRCFPKCLKNRSSLNGAWQVCSHLKAVAF